MRRRGLRKTRNEEEMLAVIQNPGAPAKVNRELGDSGFADEALLFKCRWKARGIVRMTFGPRGRKPKKKKKGGT